MLLAVCCLINPMFLCLEFLLYVAMGLGVRLEITLKFVMSLM